MGIDWAQLGNSPNLAFGTILKKESRLRSSLDFPLHLVLNLKSLKSILSVKEYFQINASASKNSDMSECLTT